MECMFYYYVNIYNITIHYGNEKPLGPTSSKIDLRILRLKNLSGRLGSKIANTHTLLATSQLPIVCRNIFPRPYLTLTGKKIEFPLKQQKSQETKYHKETQYLLSWPSSANPNERAARTPSTTPSSLFWS